MCGCNGGAAAASGSTFVVVFANGDRSAPYPDETSARVALARSGMSGSVKAVAKV